MEAERLYIVELRKHVSVMFSEKFNFIHKKNKNLTNLRESNSALKGWTKGTQTR